MKNKLLAFACAIVLFSCASHDEIPEEITQLEGTWVRDFNNVKQVLVWKSNKTGMYTANLFVNGIDTVIMDEANLSKETGWDIRLTYPENNIEEHYEFSPLQDNQVDFINNNKEWPQVIHYQKINDSTLTVTTKGISNGHNKEISFTFMKEKL